MAEEVVFSLFSVISWCFSCFLNVLLVALVFYLLYKIIVVRRYEHEEPETPSLPEMKRRDFTVEELRVYDGVNPESDGRILIAVNGNVFDVTKGRKYYGLGGPYSLFAGRDASRGLGTFNMTQVKDEYDDLSDLQHAEMESVKEWELQFRERYDLVGRLLKPGERHRSYSDEEDEDEELAAAEGQEQVEGDSKSKTE